MLAEVITCCTLTVYLTDTVDIRTTPFREFGRLRPHEYRAMIPRRTKMFFKIMGSLHADMCTVYFNK